MKKNLLFAALSVVFASPTVSAKTEMEMLRSKCAEQERQIQHLERENSRLRNEAPAATTKAPAATTKAPAPEEETASPSTTYTVKAGDSIDKIARKAGIAPATLAKRNGLKQNAIIQPGQKLILTSKVAAPPVAVAAPTATPPATTESRGSYTIKPGDTYSSISRKLKIPVATLIAANPKVKPSAMRTGQVIQLGTAKPATMVSSPSPKPAAEKPAALATPSSVAVSEPKKLPTAAPAPPVNSATAPISTPAAAPAASKPYRPVTIDGEMTYGEFATKHGTDAARLNALNGLDLNNTTVLAKGSELYVPSAQ